MVGAPAKNQSDGALQGNTRRRATGWRILIQQHLLSPGPMLAELPPSLNNQNIFIQATNQPQSNQEQSDAAHLFQVATELFQMSCTRMDAASANMEKAAEALKEVTSAVRAGGVAFHARAEMMPRNDLDLRLGRNYAQARQGEDHVHTLFQSPRRSVRQFATWFLENATPEELNSIWIEFGDRPVCGISGFYIREWLAREKDLNDSMAFAAARLLSRDEGRKKPDSVGKCLYVLHDWAAKAAQGGSSTDECVSLFDRPKKKFRLAEVTKIVPFIKIGDNFASIYIDLPRKSSLLIHPAASARPVDEVDAEFRPLLQHLTYVALANMNSLTFKQHSFENWNFGVALHHHQPVEPNNSGIVTLFYSIPHDDQHDQFMPVSHINLENAKHHFIHSLVKMCFPLTRKTIKKGIKRKRSEKKRGPDGKFAKESSSDQSSAGSVSIQDQSQAGGSVQAEHSAAQDENEVAS